MRMTRPALLLFAFAFVVATSNAQQSSTPIVPTRDAQAVALLQSAIKAMGGAAPSDSTANGAVTETIGPESQNGTIQVLTKGTGESLESINLPDLSESTAYSYLLAGQTDGSSAQQQLSGQLAMTSQTALYPLPLFAGALANADISLQYIGQETAEGVAAQHIRFWNTFASKPVLQTLATFSVRDVWLNASTGLPVKISFTRQASSGLAFQTLVELDFSNYQQTGGFAYPSQIVESLNGTPWLTIAIQSMAFNTGLQDIQFQVNCIVCTN